MSESVEAGASIAWRLLATLEGGSLILVTSALLAYTASYKIARKQKNRRPVRSVLVTNTNNELGRTLKNRLEEHGCVVSTLTSGADSDLQVDALIVVGAEPKPYLDLNGITDLVTKDVYDNIKLLEYASTRVNRGGYIAWACSGADADAGAFSDTAAAFDTVLQASLQHVAKAAHCEAVWVGRCDGAERTAERVVAALVTHNTYPNTRFSFRNAAMKVGVYLYGCLKTAT